MILLFYEVHVQRKLVIRWCTYLILWGNFNAFECSLESVKPHVWRISQCYHFFDHYWIFYKAGSVTLLENLSSILCNFVRRDETKMYQSFWISEQRFNVWYIWDTLRASSDWHFSYIHTHSISLARYVAVSYNIFTVISESCLIHTTAWLGCCLIHWCLLYE